MFEKALPGIMRRFKLTELSGVDAPAQEGARAVIMKRDDLAACAADVAKYLEDPVRAQSFTEVVAAEAARRAQWKMDEWVWPLIDALRTSITTTLADETLSPEQKAEANARNVAGFAQAVTGKPAAAEITKFLKAGLTGEPPKPKEITMAGEPTVADLQKSVADLTTVVEKLTADNAALKAKAAMGDMDDDEKEVAKGLTGADLDAYVAKSKDERKAIAKARTASDEVLKTASGIEIRKSVVGADVFAVMKSQEAAIAANAAELAKANEANAMAGFEKRAASEFGAAPGTTADKARVLKALAGDAEATKAFVDIAKACSSMIEKGFDTIGHNNGQMEKGDVAIEKARGDFNAEVQKIMARDSIGKQAAMAKARQEHPKLFDAIRGTANEN